MILNLRCSDDGKFGFVERYSPYVYVDGAIHIKALATAGGYFSKPFIMRGGEFISAQEIEKEMGIQKYIKAKKPFYSVLGEGNLIVDARIAYDLKTNSYIKSKSVFNMYGIVKDTLTLNDGIWSVELRRLSSSSKELEDWVTSVSEKIAVIGNDREQFLKSRF